MPLYYHIDAPGEMISWVLEGSLTDDELLKAVQILRADPEYRPRYSRLIDATKARPSGVTGEVVSQMAHAHSGAHARKVALVAVADAAYGMARMYEIYCDGIPCQVFRDRSEALAWLAADGPA